MSAKDPIILAGDIGGTKANLGYYRLNDEKLDQLIVTRKNSRDYGSLACLIEEFVNSHHLKADYVCLSVAGPVVHGKCKATNLPWTIDSQELAQRLALTHLDLINDLEANAHGIYELTDNQFTTINQGDRKAYGNAAVISAGTGLGQAGILWSDGKMLPFASEGGHADFAPTNEIQSQLWRYLSAKEEHVSYERVLSGMGLKNIYDFLRDTGKHEEPAWLAAEFEKTDPAVAISQAGLSNQAPICIQALDIFSEIYGAEAGNLALKLMATGGVFLGGGIAPKIIAKICQPQFMRAFLNKGRLRELLEVMPVKVIMNDKTALFGAARCALLHAGIFHHARTG